MDKKQKILEMTNQGFDVFRHYISSQLRPKKKFLNPLYPDHKASAHVIQDPKSRKYFLYDFGDPQCSGDCFWFVGEKFGLDLDRQFPEILNQIIKDLGLPIFDDNVTRTKSQTKRSTSKSKAAVPTDTKESMKKYSYKAGKWTDVALGYWVKYGIGQDILEHYNVVPLQNVSSTNDKGQYTIKSSLTSPMFGYLGDTYLKIYRPYETNRFMWVGKKPSTYIFGFLQLPQNGDVVIITGGEKDVLSLAAHGFSAICLNSETAKLSESTVRMLCERFSHVIMMYDCDDTGIRAMADAAEQFKEFEEFMTLQLPLSGIKTEKDVSDYFAMGKTREDLMKLIDDAIDELDADDDLLCESCELDFDNPPSPSPIIISINGVPIGVCDNLMCITGGSGTGKSNFVSALLGGSMAVGNEHIDTLGFDVARNISGKAVVLYDTEQSNYQLYTNADRSFRRAGIEKRPEYYHAYYLSMHNRKTRLKVIKKSMDKWFRKYKGIHSVVIDGVADLVKTANDEGESIALIAELQNLAQKYHTCVICVLHYVPNGIKLRGHLGSELQRKASGILAIEKDLTDKSKSLIKVTKVRDGDPMKVPIMMMCFDETLQRFVGAGQKSEEDNARREAFDLKAIAGEVFEIKPGYTYTELVTAIKDTYGVAERTAKDYVQKMYKLKYTYKSGDLYVLGKIEEL